MSPLRSTPHLLVGVLLVYYFASEPAFGQAMTEDSLSRSASYVSWCDVDRIPSDSEYRRRLENAQRLEEGVGAMMREYQAREAANTQYLYCTAFIHGFGKGDGLAAAYASIRSDQRLYCAPPGTRDDQIALIWRKWLLEHPQAHHLEPGTTLWLAMNHSYPCGGGDSAAELALKHLLALQSE